MKSNLFKIISVISVVIALYLIFDSIIYIWTVYSSLYDQVGLAKTIITFFTTIELAIPGIGLLFMPVFNLFGDETSVKKMIQTNIHGVIMALLLIQLLFPMWVGFITFILLKFF